MVRKHLAAIALLASFISPLAIGCGRSSGTRGAMGSEVVSWNEAQSHVGETASVEGPVMGARYAVNTRRKPTFLDLGKSYPATPRFTIVIWGSNRSKFPTPPETAYRGKTVCVTGKIETYKGGCEIIVNGPEQIEVVQ